MKRYYFVSDDLDDLVRVEAELKARGISVFQLHVLSREDAEVERRKLHEVASIMKRDMVQSAKSSAALGLVACLMVLTIVHFAGLAANRAGWLPYIFLAVLLLVFFTWEGGLKGIQEPNRHFRRFENLLGRNKHIFFADLNGGQAEMLQQVVARHPKLQGAGIEPAGAHWVVTFEQKWHDVMRTLP